MKLFKGKGGFTLIELIVVMVVFLFIIGAAIGIFISVVRNQKQVLSEQELLNQISYVEEYMSKALRVAAADTSGSCLPLGSNNEQYIYLLTHYNTSGQNAGFFSGVKFINQLNGVCQEFFWDTDGILKEIKDGAAAVALTPSDLQINYVRFSINGSDGSAKDCANPNQCGASNADPVQPRLAILLGVKISGAGGQNRIIQTTVSQRNLNVK